VSDLIKVLNHFSNYSHLETDDNEKTSRYLSFKKTFFQQYFSYIGGGNQRKTPTCHNGKLIVIENKGKKMFGMHKWD
jgi:hypothetical protein